jgi:hypothetical protein
MNIFTLISTLDGICETSECIFNFLHTGPTLLQLKWNIHGFVSDDPSQSLLCGVRKEYLSVTCNIPA